ncbi:hypothetical protein GCM10009541_31400 [Micromonospora gifhornensis]|uniref:Uncharacterized protein n=1 Tax=Micromonospora gifhornensis TaxID=84594 RepID=A0ABQ4IG15_9ACTN|nr:hypothetical protein Vgi01_35400 [Micromonospora gifhornensis]
MESRTPTSLPRSRTPTHRPLLPEWLDVRQTLRSMRAQILIPRSPGSPPTADHGAMPAATGAIAIAIAIAEALRALGHHRLALSAALTAADTTDDVHTLFDQVI